MDRQNVIVFFESPNGRDGWKPVERENIPDWLRDETLIDRMVEGEMIYNETKRSNWYRVTVVNREPVSDLARLPRRNFAYLHKDGCGGPAFYLATRPKLGDPVPRASEVILPNGAHPVPGRPIACGTCGERLWKISSVGWRISDIVAVT